MFIFIVNFHSLNKPSNFRSILFVKCLLNKLALFAGRRELVNKASLCSPSSLFSAGDHPTSPWDQLSMWSSQTTRLNSSHYWSHWNSLKTRQKSVLQKCVKFCHHRRDGMWSPKLEVCKAEQPGITPPLQRAQTSTVKSQKPQCCRKQNLNCHHSPYQLPFIFSSLTLETEKQAVATLVARRNTKLRAPQFLGFNASQSLWEHSKLKKVGKEHKYRNTNVGIRQRKNG